MSSCAVKQCQTTNNAIMLWCFSSTMMMTETVGNTSKRCLLFASEYKTFFHKLLPGTMIAAQLMFDDCLQVCLLLLVIEIVCIFANRNKTAVHTQIHHVYMHTCTHPTYDMHIYLYIRLENIHTVHGEACVHVEKHAVHV